MDSALTRSVPTTPSPRLCERFQWQICRLAVGAPLRGAATALARHVRDCRTCDAFADELGRARRWLAERPSPAARANSQPDTDGLARRALAREFLARLARDLLALGRGKAPRPLEIRQQDVRRLDGLGPARWWATDAGAPWCAAVTLAVADGPVSREAAFEGAALLDPLGLDVALAWMSCLERSGRGALAHRLADRLLCGLT